MDKGDPNDFNLPSGLRCRSAEWREVFRVREHTVAMLLPQRCMRPRCPREAKVFGLCRSCYGQARQVVLAGLTTWEELRRNGKVAEPRRTAKEWLLGK